MLRRVMSRVLFIQTSLYLYSCTKRYVLILTNLMNLCLVLLFLLMMLHLSVGWTVFDVINQMVASESWKMNSKVRGDQWRPAKNPPMAKLVSLWFLMSRKWKEVSECLPFSQIRAFIAHLQNNRLPSCKSTVSAETVITVFDTVSFGLIDLTVDGNDYHQFCRLRSEVWCPKSKQ